MIYISGFSIITKLTIQNKIFWLQNNVLKSTYDIFRISYMLLLKEFVFIDHLGHPT